MELTGVILPINMVLSGLVFWIAAKTYVLPSLPRVRPQAVLLPILLLHALRHLGLMFLAPGATYLGLPAQFAYPAAFGDLVGRRTGFPRSGSRRCWSRTTSPSSSCCRTTPGCHRFVAL